MTTSDAGSIILTILIISVATSFIIYSMVSFVTDWKIYVEFLLCSFAFFLHLIFLSLTNKCSLSITFYVRFVNFYCTFVLSLCVSLQSVTLAMLLKITFHKLYPVQLTVNTLTAFLRLVIYARGGSGVF